MIVVSLIVMIAINVFLIYRVYKQHIQIESLTYQLNKMRKRKIKVSNSTIRLLERNMAKAIESGDINQYKVYRDIYNDFSLKTSS